MIGGFFPPTRGSAGALVGLVTGYVTARHGKGGPAGNPESRSA